MKIRKDSAALQSEAQLRNLRQQTERNAVGQFAGNAQSKKDVQVDVSMSRQIQQQFNASQLDTERAEKVEKLKEMIQAGTYRASSESVAEALVQEIDFDIADANRYELALAEAE